MNYNTRRVICENLKGVIDVLAFNDDDNSASDGIRPARGKVLLQEIRCDVEGVIAVSGALELAAADDPDAILAHKPPDTPLSDTNAQLVQLLGHPWSTVAAQAQAVLIADMGEEHHVAPLAIRRGPVLPGMKSAF